MAVETNNLLLGPGELFFKRAADTAAKWMRVGNLKGTVSFAYEMDTVEQKPGNRLTIARRDKIGERATLSATIGDFKVSQLIAALGVTISTTQLTLTSTLRAFEEMVMGSTTDTKTLGKTTTSVTSVVVTKIDNSAKGVRGTDFTLPSKSGIKPISASFANKSLLVAYDFKDAAAQAIRVGDKINLQTVALKFTHKQSNGKFISISIPKATVMGGLTIPLSDSEYTTYNIQFAALGDMTATAGRSLFSIVRQA